MKEAIIGTLVRRLVGYLGVAGVVGIENDFVQLGGVIVAAGTLAWSIVQKIRAAKS